MNSDWQTCLESVKGRVEAEVLFCWRRNHPSEAYFLDMSLFFPHRYEIRDLHLVEESVLESLKVKADFHNFKPRPFNMLEFYDRTGHDINEMLLSCHFHGAECRAEDFKVVRRSRDNIPINLGYTSICHKVWRVDCLYFFTNTFGI